MRLRDAVYHWARVAIQHECGNAAGARARAARRDDPAILAGRRKDRPRHGVSWASLAQRPSSWRCASWICRFTSLSRSATARMCALAASAVPGATVSAGCRKMRNTSAAVIRRMRCALRMRSRVLSRRRAALSGVGTAAPGDGSNTGDFVWVAATDRRSRLRQRVLGGFPDRGESRARRSRSRPIRHGWQAVSPGAAR